jgi:hypothetical protein
MRMQMCVMRAMTLVLLENGWLWLVMGDYPLMPEGFALPPAWLVMVKYD